MLRLACLTWKERAIWALGALCVTLPILGAYMAGATGYLWWWLLVLPLLAVLA